MSLVVNSVGDNPFQPGITAETYIPDQLIAGQFQLVTDPNAILGGGAKLLRGTVLGMIKNSAAVVTAGKQASGTITFNGQPAAADTVTLNGTVITFIAAGVQPVGNQVNIGATVAVTMENFVAFCAASADTQLVKFLYSAAGIIVTLTAVTAGTGGNALTIAKSSANLAVSGATLANGAANTGGGSLGSVALQARSKQGTYQVVCTAIGTPAVFSVTDPDGEAMPAATAGVAYVDAQINFTITASGTAFAVADQFNIAVGPGYGKYVLSVATAGDGSEVPLAILADDTDATAADVTAAVYLTGEFNQNRLWFDPSWNVNTLSQLLRKFSIFLKPSIQAVDPF